MENTKTSFCDKIWFFKLANPFLEVIKTFILVFCICVYIISMLIIQKLNIKQGLFMAIATAGAILLYASMSFLPDLLRLVLNIERKSKTELAETKPLRFLFIRLSYSLFRVIALALPIILILLYSFSAYLNKLKRTPRSISWAGPYLKFFLIIIPALYFFWVILKRLNLLKTLYRHLPIIIATTLIYGFNVPFAGLVLVIYTALNIMRNIKIKLVFRLIALGLLLLLIIGSFRIFVSSLEFAEHGTLELLGVSPKAIVGISMLVNYDVWSEKYSTRYDEYRPIWEKTNEYGRILSNRLIGIPFLLIISTLISILFWIISDLLLSCAQIERNFRPILWKFRLPKELRYWVFLVGQIVIFLALTAFAYLAIIRNFNWPQVDLSFKETSLLSGIGTFVFRHVTYFSFFTYLKFILFIGLAGNLVRIVSDVKTYTDRRGEKKPLGFFALNAFTQSVYAVSIIYSAFIILIAISIAKITAFHEMRPLFILTGLMMAILCFFVLTFFAALGRNLLLIEANLRQKETTSGYPGYFGISFFAYTGKTIAVMGALSIILLPNLLASKYGHIPFIVNVLLFIIGVGYYVATAAVPDIFFCLIRIENHIKQGSIPVRQGIIPESTELEIVSSRIDGYCRSQQYNQAIYELHRLMSNRSHNLQMQIKPIAMDCMTRLLGWGEIDAGLLGTARTLARKLGEEERYSKRLSEIESILTKRKIQTLIAEEELAKKSGKFVQESEVIRSLEKLGIYDYADRKEVIAPSLQKRRRLLVKRIAYSVAAAAALICVVLLYPSMVRMFKTARTQKKLQTKIESTQGVVSGEMKKAYSSLLGKWVYGEMGDWLTYEFYEDMQWLLVHEVGAGTLAGTSGGFYTIEDRAGKLILVLKKKEDSEGDLKTEELSIALKESDKALIAGKEFKKNGPPNLRIKPYEEERGKTGVEMVDGDFSSFFEKFRTDREFQIQRTIFPFKDEGMDAPTQTVNSTKLIQQEEWEYHNFASSESLVYEKPELEEQKASIRVTGPGTGVSIYYLFEKREGKWYLVKRQDWSM